MGLVRDLGLTGNEFANASTFYFVAYLIAELPTGFILNKVPAGKYLGINVTLWGIATACTAATRGYGGLLAARVFLSIFEAAIAPCLMLLGSQWYTKSEQAPRFSLWYCGLGAGQMIGWQSMFVTLGVVTVVVGGLTIVFMPDSPLTARFLTEEEKAALLQHVSDNRTGVVNRHFSPRQILEIFTDPQIWLLCILTILLSVTSGVVTIFSATLLATMGFSPKLSALLNIGSGPVSNTAAIVSGLTSRRASNKRARIVTLATPGIVGGALLSFMDDKGDNTGWDLSAANVAGQTKIAVLATLAGGAFVSCLLYVYYRLVNRQRDRRSQGSDAVAHGSFDEKWANPTDKEMLLSNM